MRKKNEREGLCTLLEDNDHSSVLGSLAFPMALQGHDLDFGEGDGVSTQYRIMYKGRHIALDHFDDRKSAEEYMGDMEYKDDNMLGQLYLEQRQVSDYWEKTSNVDEQKLTKLRG